MVGVQPTVRSRTHIWEGDSGNRAPESRRASAHILAPAWLAVAQAAQGGRLPGDVSALIDLYTRPLRADAVMW
jgi:hypothetical protein